VHQYLEVPLHTKNRRLVDAIVSNAVPVPSGRGGFRKVILGIPRAEQHDIIWKVVWALSAIASMVSIVLTYMALGQAPNPSKLIMQGFASRVCAGGGVTYRETSLRFHQR
jgi:hypothetical protein